MAAARLTANAEDLRGSLARDNCPSEKSWSSTASLWAH